MSKLLLNVQACGLVLTGKQKSHISDYMSSISGLCHCMLFIYSYNKQQTGTSDLKTSSNHFELLKMCIILYLLYFIYSNISFIHLQ